MQKIVKLTAALFCLSSPAVFAGTLDTPTPIASPSMVQPQLNVAIDKSTEAVTFVNTNNDPFVYTKVYKLKNADPYEIRPYIMAAIRSRRVDTNETKVEAIKYMDGTGMLIVSAEDYRFNPEQNAMTIDEIVAELDKPGLSAEAGREFFVYYPKYYDSVTLASLVKQIGMQNAGDVNELTSGVDQVVADTKLNAMMFYTTPSSRKTVDKMLAEYDGAVTEAIIDYQIYELERENDGNLGLDFQAWKNGPGADIFATGARYIDGWNLMPTEIAGNLLNYKSAHSSFINFNPKWNAKYLDFLVSKSRAKVISSGSLSIGNGFTGSINSVIKMPVIVDGEQISVNENLAIAADLTSALVAPADALSGLGYTQDGYKAVSYVPDGTNTAQVTGTKTTYNGVDYYTFKCNYGYFEYGTSKTHEVRSFNAAPTLNGADLAWTSTTEYGYDIERSTTRVTDSNTEYGFNLTLSPYVYNEVTTLDLDMSNTNLIGFRSDGYPRTSKTELKTSLQVSNNGDTFYIGGLEKSALVRSVSKVPLLGDIPFIGFLFSAESENIKKTEIVAVLTVVPVMPDNAVSPELKAEADKILKKNKDFGTDSKFYKENDYGFDQFFFDKDKKRIDE